MQLVENSGVNTGWEEHQKERWEGPQKSSRESGNAHSADRKSNQEDQEVEQVVWFVFSFFFLSSFLFLKRELGKGKPWECDDENVLVRNRAVMSGDVQLVWWQEKNDKYAW